MVVTKLKSHSTLLDCWWFKLHIYNSQHPTIIIDIVIVCFICVVWTEFRLQPWCIQRVLLHIHCIFPNISVFPCVVSNIKTLRIVGKSHRVLQKFRKWIMSPWKFDEPCSSLWFAQWDSPEPPHTDLSAVWWADSGTTHTHTHTVYNYKGNTAACLEIYLFLPTWVKKDCFLVHQIAFCTSLQWCQQLCEAALRHYSALS